ncbi:MAG TPA: aspartate aminotransferase family protein [Chloroflexota bacterium]|nr:aspartate aminotransferase family protein [Chloroflexota bacterium]
MPDVETSHAAAWMERESRSLMFTYRRYPIVAARGEGCRLWDVDGKPYLDFLGGLAVCSLGHAPQVVADTLARQAAQLVQTSNLLYTLPQIELAEFLIQRSAFDRVFFSNSGAEANEGALKLARKWGKRERGGAYRVIAAENSFHGRTLGTVAATGNAAYRRPFEPMPDGYDFVPFNNVDAIADAVTEDTVAVILEPIQAEGGVNVPDPRYFADVRALCDERRLMLIFDEVQTGVGRTGTLWAYEQWGVEPDVMTLAKGLGSGFPIGATLAKERFAVFEPGDHASTFGGNPLACGVALAVQREIEALELVRHVDVVGHYFTERLADVQKRHPVISDIRGRGLLLAVEFAEEIARTVLDDLRDRGLIANALSPRTLRFVPPLIVSQEEVDEAVDILDASLAAR